MKRLIITILLYAFSINALPITPSEDFNIELMEIYNSLIGDDESQELIGKEYTVSLSIRFASKKYLLFNDTYIRTSDTESYQIAKWEFSPSVVKNIIGKSNIKYNVTFKILNARKSQPYKGMPHIIAEILKISPN